MPEESNEIVERSFRSVVNTVREIMESEDPVTAVNERTYGLGKYKLYILRFSGGGPADFLEFVYDPENRELIEIRYVYVDISVGGTIIKVIPSYMKEYSMLEQFFYDLILIE